MMAIYELKSNYIYQPLDLRNYKFLCAVGSNNSLYIYIYIYIQEFCVLRYLILMYLLFKKIIIQT